MIERSGDRKMKDSGVEWIGEIPEEWNVVKAKYLVQITNGTNPTTEGDVPVYGSGADSFKTCGECKKGPAVLIGRKGTVDIPRYLTGLYWNVDTAFDVKPKKGIFLKYYYYLACCFDYKYYTMQTTLPSMTQAQYNHMKLPAPSMNIQRRIADYLDRKCAQIDSIISRQQAIIEKLKEYKLSLITEAVTKGLNPDAPMKGSGVEWIGNIKEDYQITRIGALCFVTKLAGFEYTSTMVSALEDNGEVPVVRAQNVKMFQFHAETINEYINIDVSTTLNRCALNRKCVLLTFIGAGIGDVCVFDEKRRFHLGPNVAKIEVRKEFKSMLDEHFLMYYLGSCAGKGEISKISKASAQPSLSMGTIRSMKLILPSLSAQLCIVEYLDEKTHQIDAMIKKKQTLISQLTAYKKSLIYEAVTGKREI